MKRVRTTYHFQDVQEKLQAVYLRHEDPQPTLLVDELGEQKRTPEPGRCFKGDGVAAYVAVNQFFNAGIYAGVTHSFWFNGGLHNSNRLMSAPTTPKNPWSSLGVGLTGVIFVTSSAGTSNGTIDVSTGWHHVALVYNFTTKLLKLYIDGVLDITLDYSSMGTAPNGGGIDTILSGSSSTNFHSAALFDVRLYTVDKTEEEVKLIRDFKEDRSNLFLWYPCETGKGTAAVDCSGNNRHGEILNANLSTFHNSNLNNVYSRQNTVGFNHYFAIPVSLNTYFPTNLILGDLFTFVAAYRYGDGTDTLTNLFRGNNLSNFFSKGNPNRFSLVNFSGVKISYDLVNCDTNTGAGYNFIIIEGEMTSPGVWNFKFTDHAGNVDIFNNIEVDANYFSNGTLSLFYYGRIPGTTFFGGLMYRFLALQRKLTSPEVNGLVAQPDKNELDLSDISISANECSFRGDIFRDGLSRMITRFGAVMQVTAVDQTTDIMGEPLKYSGRVRYDGLLKSARCIYFDGLSHAICSNTYVSAADTAELYRFEFSIIGFASNNAVQAVFGSSNANTMIGMQHNFLAVDLGQGIWGYTGLPTDFRAVITYNRTTETLSYKIYYLNGTLYAEDSENQPHTAFDFDALSLRNGGSRLNQVKLFDLRIYKDDVLVEHWPGADRWMDTIYSSGGKHAALVNHSRVTAWGSTQNWYHYNALESYTLYTHNTEPELKVPFGLNGKPLQINVPAGYTKVADYTGGGRWINPSETKVDFSTGQPDSVWAKKLLSYDGTMNNYEHGHVLADPLYNETEDNYKEKKFIFKEA